MSLATAIPPAIPADAYRYEELPDFRGGLSLRADQFNLTFNESPAVLNVTFDPRGGVERRNSVDALNATVLSNSIIALGMHSETPVAGGADQILAACLNSGGSAVELWYGTGGNFTQIAITTSPNTLAGTRAPFFVTLNDATYIGNGVLYDTSYSTVKWTGANDAARMTPDIDGSDGHFPAARHAVVWGERMWVGYTLESGTTYANRVRFSKINDAENWTATDYIDIDIGEDGDHITALLPDGDRLLVFKQNSVYAVYGFDAASYQVQNLTRVIGCKEDVAPISSPQGVFVWYASEGLYLITRDSVIDAFERIRPAIALTALTLGTSPSMMWWDEKLWLSVDYQSGESVANGSQTNRRNVFVWDPTLSQAGAWTRYDINARSLFAYSPPGGTHLGLGVTSDWDGTAAFKRVSKFEQTADADDYTGASAYATSGTAYSSGDTVSYEGGFYKANTSISAPAGAFTLSKWDNIGEISSHYQTRWLHGNRPTFRKRWGKTRTVLLAENTVNIDYTIYKDYNLASGLIVDSKTIEGQGSTSVWGTATWVNDAENVGNGVWSSEGLSKVYEFFRWPTAGTARAISVRLSVNPAQNLRGKWGMTSLVGMYRTRRIR